MLCCLVFVIILSFIYDITEHVRLIISMLVLYLMCDIVVRLVIEFGANTAIGEFWIAKHIYPS